MKLANWTKDGIQELQDTWDDFTKNIGWNVLLALTTGLAAIAFISQW